jgi:hypothetical protein
MLRPLAQRPILFFFVVLGLSFIGSITLASALNDIFPSKLMFILAIGTSIIVTVGVFMLRSHDLFQGEGVTLGVSAVSSVVFVVLFFTLGPILNVNYSESSSAVDELTLRVENLENQVKNIEIDLQKIGLTVAQIQSIQDTYVKNGNLTISDLTQLGLNQTQISQVEALLTTKGFITEVEINALATETAINDTVNAQATETATCYIQPIHRTVNVRFTPHEPIAGEEDDNHHSFLSQRETVVAIAHNGGSINTTRWWLIEFPNEQEDKRKYAWVWSGVVKEQNLSICDSLPQYSQ